MKTAKEMFEELGYELKHEDSMYIIYEHFNFENGVLTEIKFDKILKTYTTTNYNRNNLQYPTYVNVSLHEAITQQMKELGWIK